MVADAAGTGVSGVITEALAAAAAAAAEMARLDVDTTAGQACRLLPECTSSYPDAASSSSTAAAVVALLEIVGTWAVAAVYRVSSRIAVVDVGTLAWIVVVVAENRCSCCCCCNLLLLMMMTTTMPWPQQQWWWRWRIPPLAMPLGRPPTPLPPQRWHRRPRDRAYALRKTKSSCLVMTMLIAMESTTVAAAVVAVVHS